MTQEEALEIFKETGAMLEGHFLLSSGLHSPQYLQCALVLQQPRIAERLCSELASKFRNKKPTVVIAPAMGGIIVSYEVARALGAKSLFAERVNGKMSLRRGFTLNKTDKVLVCEDVITTGLSTKEVVDVVNAHGVNLVGVGCLVYRAKDKIDFGVETKSIVSIDIPAYEPEECPLCKKGLPLVKPGSRS
ncbi:MAG: orotate phosphoribosyltransferase [Candidatus Omnitrophica bacterium]|nr:orotate phosphoribosyltransferase [Candidatus Omnitrophota bacterium]